MNIGQKPALPRSDHDGLSSAHTQMNNNHPGGLRPAGSGLKRARPVFAVMAGTPTWHRLSRLAADSLAKLATRAITHALKTHGRTDCHESLRVLRRYLTSHLSLPLLETMLEICLSQDRIRCHNNPTDCQALEYWRVFYTPHQRHLSVVHHEFAFPKTSNYPEIVHNLELLLGLMSEEASTATSFKLKLKHCEIGYLLEKQILQCLPQFSELRILEIPGLATDPLLHVIARHCTNLETLNLKGSWDQISDEGFAHFVEQASWGRERLRNLDLTRCSLSHQSLLALRRLTVLHELKVSTKMLDDINFSCDGQAVLLQSDTGEAWGLENFTLPSVSVVRVETNYFVTLSINKIMTYLRNVFPQAHNVELVNCIACELHVTLTRYPTNITYMRENVHTLELISADYFNFPRLVYPCPNLESLAIDKPTNDVFNVDQQHVPLLYGNTVPFINLKHLKLSRISLTNLSHFVSKSGNLKKFKVTNIGRRERPRWTDERIRQIFPPESAPLLEEFHVSCLPTEGLSTTSDTHRYLHLTQATVQYLTDHFPQLRSIRGIESWWVSNDCNAAGSLNALLNNQSASTKARKHFNVISA